METVINISAALLLLLSSARWYIVHAAALITGYMEQEGANEEMSDLWVHFFSHQITAEFAISAVMMHFSVLA